MNNKPNILIAGPLPPPAGGVSIHISRLSQVLSNQYNLDFIDESSIVNNKYYQLKSLNPFGYLKRILKADVLFIHSGNRILKKFHIIIGILFFKKIVITIHGYGKRKNFIYRTLDSFFFNLAGTIILVNPEIFQKVSLNKSKCIVKHAFLPPVMSEENPLPQNVMDRINQDRLQHKTIICANASKLTLFNSEDLYGLDITIEAAKLLLAKNIAFDIIYIVSSLEIGAEKFKAAQQMIKAANLENHFLLLHEKLSFVKLIENSDIVIRPTNTDGDALTIREALYFDKKTIASDIVERPEGTILFKTRNVCDLAEKIDEAITKIHTKELFITSKNNNETIFYNTLFRAVLKN